MPIPGLDENNEEAYRNSAVVNYIHKLNPEYNLETLHKLKSVVNKLFKLKKVSSSFKSMLEEPEPEKSEKDIRGNTVQKKQPYKLYQISSQIPSLSELVDNVMVNRMRQRKQMHEEATQKGHSPQKILPYNILQEQFSS